MTDTLDPRRLLLTPLSDLARGRVSGRLDWRRRIEASDLPSEARDLVMRVVRRTRLWRSERVAVADELMAHFDDGMASGVRLQDLIRDFGDPIAAALLIRRARRRARPAIWHFMRTVGWTAATLLAIYTVLEVRYLVGRATPTVDYNVALNAKVLATPPEDRGWPLYRRAILALDDPALSAHDEHSDPLESSRPGAPNWPLMQAWLAAHRDAFGVLREAAAKPVLGYIRGDAGSKIDPEFAARFKNEGWIASAQAPDERWIHLVGLADSLYGNGLNRLVNLLKLDVLDAREIGDTPRLVADVRAMLGIARQVRASKWDEWSRWAADQAYGAALDAIEKTLHKRPALLDDDALILLAHELSGGQVAADWIDLSAEYVRFQDLVQNIYTDDGHGNGRLTDRGRNYIVNGRFSMSDYTAMNVWQRTVTQHLFPPTAIGDTRRAAIAEYDEVFAKTNALLALPRRSANWDSVFSPDRPIWDRRPTRDVHTTAVYNFARSFQNEQEQAEYYFGRRDGIVVGIALELYHRQNGGYPPSLAALTPAILPHIPADRMTGEPLRYRLVDGWPIVYSVGVDRVDNGGRFIIDSDGTQHPHRASTWTPEGKMRTDGDWVMYDVRPKKPTTQPD